MKYSLHFICIQLGNEWSATSPYKVFKRLKKFQLQQAVTLPLNDFCQEFLSRLWTTSSEKNCFGKIWKSNHTFFWWRENKVLPAQLSWNVFECTCLKLNNLLLSFIFTLDQLSILCAKLFSFTLPSLVLFCTRDTAKIQQHCFSQGFLHYLHLEFSICFISRLAYFMVLTGSMLNHK